MTLKNHEPYTRITVVAKPLIPICSHFKMRKKEQAQHVFMFPYYFAEANLKPEFTGEKQ